MDCCRNCTRTNSFVLAVQEPPGRDENGQPSDEACPRDGRSERRKYEDSLIEMIQGGEYDKIEKAITPVALKSCESNALLMGMKVSYELFKAADKKGRTDKERFNQLAMSVEKYTSSLLDPLRGDQEEREQFGDALDEILDEALQFRQKKFFTHPVIDAELKRKWYGRDFIKSGWENWRPLFTVLSVFDFVLCPVLYALFLWKKSKVTQIYPMYMETPYFRFVRDTMSYIVLLVLHYALCVMPSTIPFSGLEWTIFIFFIGRCLVEQQQFRDVMERIKRQRGQSKIRLWLKTLYAYRRDLWNKLDLINLLVYLVILILRFATWISGGSVVENRVLSFAGYLYGLNTLCLTFRVFGHVMEQSEGVGTIQIALFRILKDVGTIVWQFIAVILAFSIATTKVYVAETSFLASGSGRNDTVCKTSGISCWWAMITHMGWSLLGGSDEFDPMTSVDLPSVIVAQILYAGFLVMGVILLINMLIALLSNTYQRIEENSLTEWSFKRAATIQTYDSYDPIPVPLNILYCILKWIGLVKSKAQKNRTNHLDFLVFPLDRQYLVKHGNALPLTGKAKNNIVFQETEKNPQMVNRILSSTFNSQFGGSMGEEAWQVHEDIQVQGALLTCNSDDHYPGARYRQAFCDEFPHFEVAILETGKHGLIGIGVVNDSFSTDEAPGFENRFVGYYSDGVICNSDDGGKETEGPAVASRGDCIRCTIMLEKKREIDGRCQVTVLFTLNGMKVMIPTEGQQDCDIFVDYDEPLYPFIVLSDGCRVLAKMCSRDEEKCMESEIADLSKKVTESLEETKDLGRKVTEIKASLEETKDLDRKVTEMKSGIEEANRKLNILLQRLTDVSTQGQGER